MHIQKKRIFQSLSSLMLCMALCWVPAGCGGPGGETGPEKEEQEPDGQEEEAVIGTDILFRTPDCHYIDMSYLGKREYRLEVDGRDPYVFTARLLEAIDADRDILEFDYRCTYDIDFLQIFFALDGSASENSSQRYGAFPATDTYTHFQADIKNMRAAGWGKVGDCLRLDPGSSGKGTLYIKNFRIRAITEEERQAAQEEAERIASYAYALVAETIQASPEVEGIKVSWFNEFNVDFDINVSFKGVTGEMQTVTKTSSMDDSFSVGGFTETTEVSVTVSNFKGDHSDPVKFTVTPPTGEIPSARLNFCRYSSIWNDDMGFDKVTDRNVDTYWHSEPFNAGNGPYQWFVIDLGAPHKLNAIEAIRRKTDAGYGSAIQKIQVSLGLRDQDSAYTAVIPKRDYNPGPLYAGHLFQFDEAVGRFLKVEFWTAGDWCHLSEFLVYYSPDPKSVSPYANRTD